MNSRMMAAVLTGLLAACTVWGQGNEREAVRRGRASMLARGYWIGKRVTNPEFMERVGIRGEQAERLKKEFEALDKESETLEAEVDAAALEQAEVAKRVLAEPGANTDGMMKIIERIGRCRTEQAKLATRRLVVIRDHLNQEQREKVAALLDEEQKRWHEEREAREKGAAPGNNHPNRPAAPQKARPPAPQGW